uniref:Uncharacterized protein n=1 Tax=Oryza nivara TaxID=4536 RepID=A0A0E0IZ11_ORYNI
MITTPFGSAANSPRARRSALSQSWGGEGRSDKEVRRWLGSSLSLRQQWLTPRRGGVDRDEEIHSPVAEAVAAKEESTAATLLSGSGGKRRRRAVGRRGRSAAAPASESTACEVGDVAFKNDFS